MIFLIDFENVTENGLFGIENLNANDSINIFYSENVKNISLPMHQKLEQSKVDKKYYKINQTGKNALDFQLSTYLGYLVATKTNQEFVIVSKDQGFNAVVNFWKSRNIKINICFDLTQSSVDSLKKDIISCIPKYENDVEEIINIIQNYKSKQGINNALVKLYKSEKAGEIYKAIKPLLKNKKGE